MRAINFKVIVGIYLFDLFNVQKIVLGVVRDMGAAICNDTFL